MPSSPTTTSNSSSRFRLVLRLILGLLLALLVIDLLALQLARGVLGRAEERVEAEGSSLDLHTLLPEVETPEKNAHRYIQSAGLLLETLDEPLTQGSNETLRQALTKRLRRELRFTGETPTADDLELFRRGVEHFELVLDAIDVALPIERAHFDYDHQTLIFEGYVPNLLQRLWLSDLLSARVRLAVAEGRGDEAWGDIHAMFRLATWSSQEMPTLIHRLIASALVRFATLEAETLMRTNVPSQEQMKDILAEARSWDPQATYDFALEVERAMLVTSFLDERNHELIKRQEVEGGWYAEISPWLLSPPLRPWLHWNLAVLSDAITQLSTDCREPAYRREQKADLQAMPFGSWLAQSIASENLAENLFDACNKRDRTLVDVDLMEIAFRLEEHRRQSGSYPASLDALEGVPSLDPFSGEPYVYHLSEGEAVVYSVGKNRQDDGGTPPPYTEGRGEDRYSGDLVWRLGTVSGL